MSVEDLFGNPLSTSVERAATCYNQAVTCLFKLSGNPRPWIDEALALDPDFALAHCVEARIALFESNPTAANTAAKRGVELAARATAREQSHAHIVAEVTANRPGSIDLVYTHAQQYPRDALPLSFALGVYGLLGFGCFVDHHERQLALLQSVGRHWGDEWWYNAWLGWSLVETGDAANGIPLLDSALEQTPDNATAVHGRAHGYYEMGEAAAGERFILEWLPSYVQNEPLHCHIAWHLALHQLQEGNFDAAQATYAAFISPQVSKALPMFTLVDSAAYLWRARLYGVELSEEQIAQAEAFALEHFPKPGLPFVNLHRQLIWVLAKNPRRFGELAEQKESSFVTPTTADQVGYRLVNALSKWAENRNADAANAIALTLPTASLIGGSHAQRDLIIDSLIASSLLAGDISGAKRDGLNRFAKRATHLDAQWFARMQTAAGR